jgi:hypothetical protein
MNFIEAVKEMKNGEKVTIPRMAWYAKLEDANNVVFRNHLEDKKSQIQNINTEDMEATNWEIVEEPKKTLSDKRDKNIYDGMNSSYTYRQEDVKQALKEFIEWCVEHRFQKPMLFTPKAKEIFGERLVD